MSIFGLIQKWTKKITAGKKRPEHSLHSTEISQTPPTAVGVRHEKFRTFRSGNVPGGRFFEADLFFSRFRKSGPQGSTSGD
jgi:hypothetical protein